MGWILTAEPDREHECRPPADEFPPRWTNHPVGSRYICDCGQVWIVRWVNVTDHGVQATVAHAEWFRESWRERRRRVKGKDRLSPVKPEQPPRGPSRISSSRDGSR